MNILRDATACFAVTLFLYVAMAEIVEQEQISMLDGSVRGINR